jgi:hypothetical protein
MSADGSRLTMSDGTNKLLRWERGATRLSGTRFWGNSISAVAISPDGKHLLTCSDGGTEFPGEQLLALVEFTTVQTLTKGRLGATPATAAVFSSDGQQIAVAQSTALMSFRNFLTPEWKQTVYRPAPAGPIQRLTFSPDGERLLAEASTNVMGYNTTTPAVVFNWKNTAQAKSSACFRKDNKSVLVALCSTDNQLKSHGVPTLDAGGPPVVVVKNPDPMPSARMPRPTADEIAAAEQEVHAMYKADYDNLTTNQQAISLSLKLLIKARGPEFRNKPAIRFVLLAESRDLPARDPGASSIAFGHLTDLAKDFAVNWLEEKCLLAEKMGHHTFNAAQAGPFIETCNHILEEALLEDQYDFTARVLKVARPIAGKLAAHEFQAEDLERLATRINYARTEFDRIKQSRETLTGTPDDPKANKAVGWYRCCFKEDWVGGLPLLAKGSDPTLRALAGKELTNPTDADIQKELADGWSQQADKLSGPVMPGALRRRAFFWYREALPQLTGAKQTDADKRMKALLVKMPALQNTWANLHFSPGFLKQGVVSLPAHATIRSREAWKGDIEVKALVRTAKNGFSIKLPSSTLRINPEDRPTVVEVTDAMHPGGSSFTTSCTKEFNLTTNRWHTVRWRTTAHGTKLWVDGELVLEDSRARDLSFMHSASMWGDSGGVELQSLVIRNVLP